MAKSDYQHYRPSRLALHDRAFPHRLLDDVWMWSFFIEKAGLHGNGYLIQTSPQESILIDPPLEGLEVLDAFESLPPPQCIILTNSDHERAADVFRQRFKSVVWIHQYDATGLSIPADCLFRDGDAFPGNWQAIHLSGQKTPGECALYHAEKQMLVLGDSLIAEKYQQLTRLPSSLYGGDSGEAEQGLQRLLRLSVKTILSTHGDPILANAMSLLQDVIKKRNKP